MTKLDHALYVTIILMFTLSAAASYYARKDGYMIGCHTVFSTFFKAIDKSKVNDYCMYRYEREFK